jgi:hypothetical protein
MPKITRYLPHPHTVTVVHVPALDDLDQQIERLGKPLVVHVESEGNGTTLVQAKHPKECSRLIHREPCWYDSRGEDGYEAFLDLPDGTYTVTPDYTNGRSNLDIQPIEKSDPQF